MYSICDPEVLPQVQEAYPPQGQRNTFWILLAYSEIGETWIIGGTKESLSCFTLPFFCPSDSRFAGVSVQDWQGIPERPGQASLRSLSDPSGFPMFSSIFLATSGGTGNSCAAVVLLYLIYCTFCIFLSLLRIPFTVYK